MLVVVVVMMMMMMCGVSASVNNFSYYSDY